MADEDIMFKEAEGYLRATIDNQTLDLQVKEIVKQETYITLNKDNLDTAIKDNIEFSGIIDTEEESMRDLLRSGILYVTIQDTNFNNLIETIVPFENRNFDVSISNSLPMGDYYCKIEYLESKYFLGCEYTIKFKITKRAIGYKFDKSIYVGYPNQTVNVQMYLYDYKTKLPIETTVLYKFNRKEYLGRTDKEGYITMSVTIPDVVKEDCKSFMKEICPDSPEEIEYGPYYTMDTKGWVYQNGQLIQWFDSEYHYYVGDLGINAIKLDEEEITDIDQERYHVLEIEIQSDSYTTYPISVIIHVQKSPTVIFWEDSIKYDMNVRLLGYVEGAIGRARYGAIVLTIKDEPVEYRFYIDEYGNFDYCFDPIDAMTSSSNNLEHYIEEIGNTRKITPQINFEVDKGNIINTINDNEYGKTYVYDVHDDTYLKATAKITAVKNNEVIPITEGMVCFIIYRQRYDGIWVRNYRYSEEITDDGEAEIVFDLSKDGKYYIYAEYYGMFEYNDTISQKQYYQVINDATTVKFNKKDALELNMELYQFIHINDGMEGHDLKLNIDDWFNFDTSVQGLHTAEFDPLEINKTINTLADIKKIKLNINEPDIEFEQETGSGMKNVHNKKVELEIDELDIEVTQEEDNG